MSDKKYEYIEYEKLSDAVKDWENGEQIYREIDDICTIQHNTVGQFLTSGKYAKRVEIKEVTVEVWGIFINNLLYECYDHMEEALYAIDKNSHLVDCVPVRLTGTITE